MSKYIDAEALKEKFINTDANGINLAIDRYALKCIEDAPTIEVSEDCISRKGLIDSFLADNECKREEAKACLCKLDFMLELIEDAPSVVPSRAEGEWLHKEVTSNYQVTGQCSICKERKRIDNYCPNCGAKMKG